MGRASTDFRDFRRGIEDALKNSKPGAIALVENLSSICRDGLVRYFGKKPKKYQVDEQAVFDADHPGMPPTYKLFIKRSY